MQLEFSFQVNFWYLRGDKLDNVSFSLTSIGHAVPGEGVLKYEVIPNLLLIGVGYFN